MRWDASHIVPMLDSRKAPKVIAVVREGQDHYVSTVVDAYIQ